MEATAKVEVARVLELVENLDPAQYPCALLAQLWYAWLALNAP
jgi:hypothetical protein